MKRNEHNQIKAILPYGLLAIWAGCCCVILTLLMAGHLVPFASKPARLEPALATGLLPQAGVWQGVHILRSPCECSSDVGAHLVKRARDSRLERESVVMVGSNATLMDQLQQNGFTVLSMGESEAATKFGVEAAPTMVLIDPSGKVRYSGGYYTRRERTAALDQDIISRTMSGEIVQPLPSFG